MHSPLQSRIETLNGQHHHSPSWILLKKTEIRNAAWWATAHPTMRWDGMAWWATLHIQQWDGRYTMWCGWFGSALMYGLNPFQFLFFNGLNLFLFLINGFQKGSLSWDLFFLVTSFFYFLCQYKSFIVIMGVKAGHTSFPLLFWANTSFPLLL